MYQARKVNSFFVFICWEYRFCLFLRLFYWIMELFRQFGIFFGTIPTVVFFGTVPTVWYFFWNYSDSVVFFGTVPTVWYFWNYSDSVVFFWNYSDSVVFLELFRQWYFFHFPFYSYLKQSNNDVLSKRGSFFSFSYL